jgi:predicted dehydrogenase
MLGYARIARESHLPALLRSENAEFAALASRDPAKLADSRARFGSAHRCHASYDALLADPAVDAVCIPLPNALHCEWALRAMAAGKHVLCEKPMSLNAAECEEMIAASRRHGVLLMEAFMYRFTTRTAALLEVLRSGALGEIRFIQSSFRFLLSNPASIKLRPELGGGALYDVGCYPVNLIGLVADHAAGGPGAAQPESVSVEALQEGGIDTLFSALLRYPGGLVAALHTGFNAQRRIHSEIVGTKAALEIPDTFLDSAGSLTLVTGEERREIPVASCERYRLQVEAFSASILDGRPAPLAPGESLRNARLMDRLRSAMHSRAELH